MTDAVIDDLPEIVSKIGDAQFYTSLLHVLGRQVAFDAAEICTLSPRSLEAVEYYQRNPAYYVSFPGYAQCYGDDPLYRAYQDRVPAGLYRPAELAKRYPRNATYAAYYANCTLGEELQYLIPLKSQTAMVIWLWRERRSPAFGTRKVEELRRFQSVLVACVQRHQALVSPSCKDQKTAALGPSGSAFRSHGLTPREFEILDTMIAGTSVKAAARQLGISEGTVRLHRKSIYRKLDIHSQGELFASLNRSRAALAAEGAELRQL